jgi:hypothetical protein
MRELLATGLNECRALVETMVTAANAAEAKPALSEAVIAVLAMKPGNSSGPALAAAIRS